MSQSDGERFRMARVRIANQGYIYIKDIDEDNQGIFAELRIDGQVVEKQLAFVEE